MRQKILNLFKENPLGTEFTTQLKQLLIEINERFETLEEQLGAQTKNITANTHVIAETINKPQIETPPKKTEPPKIITDPRKLVEFFIVDFSKNMDIWHKKFNFTETVPAFAWKELKERDAAALKDFINFRNSGN